MWGGAPSTAGGNVFNIQHHIYAHKLSGWRETITQVQDSNSTITCDFPELGGRGRHGHLWVVSMRGKERVWTFAQPYNNAGFRKSRHHHNSLAVSVTCDNCSCHGKRRRETTPAWHISHDNSTALCTHSRLSPPLAHYPLTSHLGLRVLELVENPSQN